jgi:hypothetical protein
LLQYPAKVVCHQSTLEPCSRLNDYIVSGPANSSDSSKNITMTNTNTRKTDNRLARTEEAQPDPVLRWKGFIRKPSQTDGSEATIFAPLVEVWNGIVNAVQEINPNASPVTAHSQLPDMAQASERPISTRPDGVISLLRTTVVSLLVPTRSGSESIKGVWEDTIASMEWKPEEDAQAFRDVCTREKST